MSLKQRVCPECGIEQILWESNEGTGFPMDDNVYCCQGCAESLSCMCEMDEQREAQAVDADTELFGDSAQPEERQNG